MAPDFDVGVFLDAVGEVGTAEWRAVGTAGAPPDGSPGRAQVVDGGGVHRARRPPLLPPTRRLQLDEEGQEPQVRQRPPPLKSQL